MTSAIRCEALTRRFGERLAVDRLDLEIAPGEVFGFLGPNGAGKTTTVRMLSALITPTGGRAWVCGRDVIGEADAVRASVGLLTETPGLYDRLSVRENLELFGRLHGVPDLAARVRRYLELLGLWDRHASPAGTLSKGLRQKLALARALLHEPPILFLDEPTSGLDPAAARMVRDFVSSLRREGRTIVLCTHNLAEAEELCDRVALFRTRLLRVDTLESLRRSLYGRAVSVRLRAGDEAGLHLAAVRALAGVREASAEGNVLRVEVEDPEAQAPELVRLLALAGAQVVSVGEEARSLEQVYLDLVERAPDAAPVEGA